MGQGQSCVPRGTSYTVVGGQPLRLSALADGGFSTVFEAIDKNGATTAVKRIICMEQEQLDCARMEIAVHNAVKHKNVMELLAHDIVPDKKRPSVNNVWLQMPLYRCTLFELAEESKYSESDALDVMQGVCNGTAALHAAGFTHRDIKPMNVLIQGRLQTPVLMDLGSCRPLTVVVNSRREAVAEQELAASQSTASYRAAELHDVPTTCVIDAKVDVWSLACTLFMLVHGRSPFENSVEGFMVLWAVAGDVRFPPDSQASEGLRSLISRCLQRDPDLRPGLAVMLKDMSALRAGYYQDEDSQAEFR